VLAEEEEGDKRGMRKKVRVKLRFCAMTRWTTDTKLMISSHSQILDTTANYEQSRDPPEALKSGFVDNKYSTRTVKSPCQLVLISIRNAAVGISISMK